MDQRPLTNAEKQARHRAKARQEVIDLKARIADLEAALAERDRENHVLRRIITEEGWRGSKTAP